MERERKPKTQTQTQSRGPLLSLSPAPTLKPEPTPFQPSGSTQAAGPNQQHPARSAPSFPRPSQPSPLPRFLFPARPFLPASAQCAPSSPFGLLRTARRPLPAWPAQPFSPARRPPRPAAARSHTPAPPARARVAAQPCSLTAMARLSSPTSVYLAQTTSRIPAVIIGPRQPWTRTTRPAPPF